MAAKHTRFIEYAMHIWKLRYFCWHLALADLRAKFRRSYFGILWSILTPLLLTTLMTIVMSSVFKTSPGKYAPYVFSGLIIWEVIVSSANMGCTAFINAEGYIKQYRHPMLIYPIRNVIVAYINFGLGFIGLAGWVLVTSPNNFGMVTMWIVPGAIMLGLAALPVSVLCGVANTKFRDFSQLVILIFQAIWYVSPIFIDENILKTSRHLHVFVDYNPVYHLLNLIRAPILRGEAPDLVNFLYVAAGIIVLWSFALIILKNNEKKLIYYL